MREPAFRIGFLLLLLLGVSGVNAQDLTGIWKGTFVTESGENYKLEFQITENKTLVVTGVSYSYLDSRFYGKSSMTGHYSKGEKSLSIQELRTVEVKNIGGGGTCLMNYKLVFSESGKEQFLEGTYLGKTEDRNNPSKNGKWGDCGGGRVFLRRVETSDFYVEPFLKEKPVTKTATPVPDKPAPRAVAKAPVKTPVEEKKKPTAIVTPKKQAAPPTTSTGTPTRKANTIDPVQRETTAAPRTIVPKPLSIPVETRSRQNETAKVFTVSHEQVTVKLYDNGEVDGDTISVYLDNQLILSRKGLATEPITLTLSLDETATEHVLVMVAENMGRIPPNTALMIVQDGDNRFQANLTSTEQKNAMVRFRYQKPKS
ncbi:MAG: hypothetical protein JWP27_1342 [Flaviaesturariibacter sp.]|nr:hypothetical protein [Flaviaesturariibacter sp.]